MNRGEDEQLQERLGYAFRDPEVLDRALTHSSAVPELLTSEYLLANFPEWSEGQLSKSRARIVNAHSLEAAARSLGIGEHLRLGRGEEKTGERGTHFRIRPEERAAGIFAGQG